MEIVTVGDNCVDFYLADNKAYPGGNALNVAVYVRRLNEPCSFVSVVGDDEYGDMLLTAMEKHGINHDYVYQEHGKTALSRVNIVNGDRVFSKYDEGVMENFELSRDALNFICKHKLMHTALWGKTEDFIPTIHKSGCKIYYDFSDNQDADYHRKLLPCIDFALFSMTDDTKETREFLMQAHSYGPVWVTATLGANGSLSFDGQQFIKLPAPRIKVVDTMGAGDSFAAGMLVGIKRGLSLSDCMKLATSSSAVTLSYKGAW